MLRSPGPKRLQQYGRWIGLFKGGSEGVSVVLVLGAGATLANAEHFHGRRLLGHHPPLDYTFFDRVTSLNILIPTELREYAAGHPYLNPFDQRQRDIRAELFFSDLFADFEEAARGTRVVRAYEQLLSIYVRVLRETTSWMG